MSQFTISSSAPLCHKHHLAIFIAFTIPLLKTYTICRLSDTLSVRLGVLSL